MKRSSLAALVITALAVIAFAGVACAGSDTIYSTLGAGGTYNTASTLDVSTGIGTSFTVTGGDYTLESITLALTLTDATPKSGYVLLLVGDKGGTPNLVDGQVEAWADTLDTGVAGSQLVTFDSGESNVLTAGSTYWLVLVDPTGGLSWNLNNSGATEATIVATGIDTWASVAGASPAYSINGTPTAATPEPSSLIAILGGLGTIGGAVIRRRK